MRGYQILVHAEDFKRFDADTSEKTTIQKLNDFLLVSNLDPTGYEIAKSYCKQLWSERKTAICWHPAPFQSAFFDMDSTIIEQECIVELAKFADSSDMVAKITEEAMKGLCSFEEALRSRAATLAGQSTDIIDKVAQRLTLNPGMSELAKALLLSHCSLHLISGGFVELASYIANKLGFQSFHANRLLRSKGKLTGEVADPIVGAEAKRQYLLDICKQGSIKPEHCMAIGDGANDRLMLEVAGFAVGYNPKPVLFDALDGAVFDSFLPLSYLVAGNALKTCD